MHPVRDMLLALLTGALALTGLASQTPDLYDTATLRTLRLTFNQVDYWQQLLNNYASKTYIRADLEVDGKTYTDVGVRFRGNTSYRASSTKKPFKISMDAFVQDQELYGFNTLNLNNGYKDPTFVREAITYEIFRRYHPACRANWVKLFINNESWGVYVNVQQINKDFGAMWFQDNDGNRYRAESSGGPRNGSALIYLGSNPLSYQMSYELKNENAPEPWTDLIEVCDRLNNLSGTRLENELPTVLSVENALWMLVTNNIFVHLDSYLGNTGHNYYLYDDLHHGRMRLICWDLNNSFGGFNMGMSVPQLQRLDPYYQRTNPGRPLLNKILTIPRWKEMYRAHFRTVLQESFRWDLIGPRITTFQNLIKQEVLADTKKLYKSDWFTLSVTQDVQVKPGSNGLVPGIKPMVDARRAFLLSHPDINRPAPTISDVAHSPSTPTPSQKVFITARISGQGAITSPRAGWRTIGAFTLASLFDDGQHGDGKAGDGVYGAEVPAQSVGTTVEYFVEAMVQGGGLALSPGAPEINAYAYVIHPGTGTSPVQIHEFVAKNDTGIQDEKGEYEDWIELLNTGTTAVDLAGYHLSDKLASPAKWKFPLNTVIQPGGTLLVWADDDAGDGPLHASFKLDADGEDIYFFHKDGVTLLDSTTFGPQQADVSTGRMAGYPTVWATFPSPTPRSPNLADPCGHLVYEALDPTTRSITLTGAGTPAVGGTATYAVSGAPALTPGYFAFALSPAQVDFGGLGALLVNPALMVLFPVTTNATGGALQNMGIPGIPGLAGQVFYFQVFFLNGQTGGFSSGVVTRICT